MQEKIQENEIEIIQRKAQGLDVEDCVKRKDNLAKDLELNSERVKGAEL